MSIRLRLTLLYTAILMLTLLAFGALLYARQYQDTLNIEKQFLIGLGDRMSSPRPVPPDRPPSEPPPSEPTPSEPPSSFTERYLIRRSPDGQEILDIQTPDNVLLPFSDEALAAVRSGETWMETTSVEGERILIYTVPVMVDGQLAEIVQLGRSLSLRDQSINALGINLLIAGLVAIVVAFGLGWLLAGISLRPIHRLTQTAQAIGTERDFSRRVEHTGPDDEVGRLAKTFNAMLAELQAAYQQLERALDMQQRFVADVSHELRTPLTTLSGNVELLRRKPPIDAADQTAVLADMASESQRLIRLVNDLLALARADARRPLESMPVLVKPLVEEVCRQARLLDPDRVIACDAPSDAAVLGQADALKQILLILLDNALKHTSEAIRVTGEVLNGHVTVSVRDSGPGIPTELLPHLFERFSRGRVDEGTGAGASTGAGEGTGLGLSIAKALAEAQGGTFTVESQVGKGSVFSVTLSAATAPPAAH
jgi:signal transduction histidine kinase